MGYSELVESYKNYILKINGSGRSIFEIYDSKVYIETKNYTEFINNNKYPEMFRSILYTYLRKALSLNYNTGDGISIKLSGDSEIIDVNIKYTDYNNFDWKLIKNDVMGNLLKTGVVIYKHDIGEINFKIPGKGTLIHSEFNTDCLNNDYMYFIDFIIENSKFNEGLSIITEVVENILYYEYVLGLRIECDKEGITVYEKN